MRGAGTNHRSFVLDASVVLAWCFEDERGEYAESVLEIVEGTVDVYAPSIWPLELRNGFLVAERRKRITVAQSTSFIQKIRSFNVQIEFGGIEELDHALLFARLYSLTVYDATYLSLAYRRGLPLATLDSNLRRAAKDAGVDLL